jgi:hypothetical protein
MYPYFSVVSSTDTFVLYVTDYTGVQLHLSCSVPDYTVAGTHVSCSVPDYTSRDTFVLYVTDRVVRNRTRKCVPATV